MNKNQEPAAIREVLHKLAHFLPTQAPLKDFVHHNTLHAFQHEPFHKALHSAATLFGYKVYRSLDEYREAYRQGEITEASLLRVLARKKGARTPAEWKEKLLHTQYANCFLGRVGQLRQNWKSRYAVNPDKEVHPLLFRLVAAFLDQGIALWPFPLSQHGFLSALREMETHSFAPIFKSKRVRKLLKNQSGIAELLQMLVGDERLYAAYLFDQQFAHPGWSGMVATLETSPTALLDKRSVSLRDFIVLELLLEIDYLDRKLGTEWIPLAHKLDTIPDPLFDPVPEDELYEVYALWQEAFEWSCYEPVLSGLTRLPDSPADRPAPPAFQVMCCIDDRTAAFRTHLEKVAPDCETFGAAGFFNVEFYYQPDHGKFFTKSCPPPLTPTHLIRETHARKRHAKDPHFSRYSQDFFGGMLLSPTIGFWAALKLVAGVFRPGAATMAVSASRHMDKQGRLSIECHDPAHRVEGMQVGFTLPEMADRVEGLLRSIGLVERFSPLVYVVGHGASSVNNTHYAGYDCGACSGRPGSVNARVLAFMANHSGVRALLCERGIILPETTCFIGALHDTTRDEIIFYDTDVLHNTQQILHQRYTLCFQGALALNARERAQRFALIDSSRPVAKVHHKVKQRAQSLFEPRPEWNHATNALCIVGRRSTNRHLALDRRAFLQSYDYRIDPEGHSLAGILRAIAPVCGGINLEYYFSKTDNYRLGAGTKLPHNVTGLIGVTNGMDGDLRTGLPLQMVNIHDPVRMMMIVEHIPEVVKNAIQRHAPTYGWFAQEWMHLIAVHPVTRELFHFHEGQFEPYLPADEVLPESSPLEKTVASHTGNSRAPIFNTAVE